MKFKVAYYLFFLNIFLFTKNELVGWICLLFLVIPPMFKFCVFMAEHS